VTQLGARSSRRRSTRLRAGGASGGGCGSAAMNAKSAAGAVVPWVGQEPGGLRWRQNVPGEL